MTHAATVTDMATRSRYVSTETPQARRLITSAVRADIRANEAAKTALEARNVALREQYAAGVDIRDLVQICRAAGWSRVVRQQIATIVRGTVRNVS